MNANLKFILEFIILSTFGVVGLVLMGLAPAKWVAHSESDNIAISERHQSTAEADKVQGEYTYIAPADRAIIDMRQRE